MFFEVEMRRMVVVEPSALGGSLHTQRSMLRRLLKDVADERGSEEHGLFVAVTTLHGVSEGKVRSGTGSVAFSVNFKCIVLRLLKNEVIEAVVTNVGETGFHAACGPIGIFVPRTEMQGFECKLGPSPEYNKWTDISGSVIDPNALVRLKVLVSKWMPEGRTFRAIGTLNGDMLGRVYEGDMHGDVVGQDHEEDDDDEDAMKR